MRSTTLITVTLFPKYVLGTIVYFLRFLLIFLFGNSSGRSTLRPIYFVFHVIAPRRVFHFVLKLFRSDRDACHRVQRTCVPPQTVVHVMKPCRQSTIAASKGRRRNYGFCQLFTCKYVCIYRGLAVFQTRERERPRWSFWTRQAEKTRCRLSSGRSPTARSCATTRRPFKECIPWTFSSPLSPCRVARSPWASPTVTYLINCK